MNNQVGADGGREGHAGIGANDLSPDMKFILDLARGDQSRCDVFELEQQVQLLLPEISAWTDRQIDAFGRAVDGDRMASSLLMALPWQINPRLLEALHNAFSHNEMNGTGGVNGDEPTTNGVAGRVDCNGDNL